jgi:pimeloyl-ACP methyl ester carboxylesterase
MTSWEIARVTLPKDDLPEARLSAPVMTQYVLDGRARLAYSVVGSGPPIVFIQGVGLHGAGWQPQVDGLSSTCTCVVFDNAGVGKSHPATGRLSIPQMAEDTLRVMDAAGFESAHLVGHSMGGCIAVEAALRARRRVRSLSLLCTFAAGRDATRLTLAMLRIGLRMTIGTARSRRRAFLELVLAPNDLSLPDRDSLAQDLQPLFGHDLARRPPIAMKQLAALRSYDPGGRLGELAGIPCLVASAAHDPIAPPATGRQLAKGIPGARYVELAGHSHGVVIRNAGSVNELLSDHVGRAEARHAEGGPPVEMRRSSR